MIDINNVSDTCASFESRVVKTRCVIAWPELCMIGSGELRPSAPQCKTRNPHTHHTKDVHLRLHLRLGSPGWANPRAMGQSVLALVSCASLVETGQMENEWQCHYSGPDIGWLLAIKVSGIWYPDSISPNGSMHAKHRAKKVVV